MNNLSHLPERDLWFAVIAQAIDDYLADPLQIKWKAKRREVVLNRDNAANWLFGSKMTSIGSFEWICNQLDLEPNCLRMSIKTLKEKLKCLVVKDDTGKTAPATTNTVG